MKPTVFYDGQCPLCRREIAHYQRLDSDSLIHFVDIYKEPTLLADYAINFDQAVREIHGINTQSCVIRGVDVFVMIWANLPRYRLIAQIVLKLKLTALLQWAYLRFASWRYQRFVQNKTCTDKRNCQEPKNG